jgi:hypothetical protein
MLNIFCLKSLMLTLHMVASQDTASTHVVTSTTDMGKIFACPRCRRAQPPGPRKRPTPAPDNGDKNDK